MLTKSNAIFYRLGESFELFFDDLTFGLFVENLTVALGQLLQKQTDLCVVSLQRLPNLTRIGRSDELEIFFYDSQSKCWD